MSGKQAGSLSVVHPECAGVDIGKRKHYVAVHLWYAMQAWGCLTT